MYNLFLHVSLQEWSNYIFSTGDFESVLWFRTSDLNLNESANVQNWINKSTFLEKSLAPDS